MKSITESSFVIVWGEVPGATLYSITIPELTGINDNQLEAEFVGVEPAMVYPITIVPLINSVQGPSFGKTVRTSNYCYYCCYMYTNCLPWWIFCVFTHSALLLFSIFLLLSGILNVFIDLL